MAIHGKIAIIGGGNLGKAIASGLIESKSFTPDQLIITKKHPESRSGIPHGMIKVTNNNQEAISQASYVIFALKPYNVLEVVQVCKKELLQSKPLLISVATGISIAAFQNILGSNFPICRAMPNTAASVGESLTCLTGSLTKDQVGVCDQIFTSIGAVVWIDEHLINASTVLGACGIAYVLRFMRAMVQGGIEIGFSADTASAIVNQTVLGAAQILKSTGAHPESEIDKVTTPKGCTIAGLNEMEHQGFSSSLIKGIKTSFEKI